MIDATDASTVDWRNPTAHMLAGRKAGKSVYQHQVKSLQLQVKKLQVIVNTLPKDAEGNPIVFGCERWQAIDGISRIVHLERIEIINRNLVGKHECLVCCGHYWAYPWECYSTRAAAETALTDRAQLDGTDAENHD